MDKNINLYIELIDDLVYIKNNKGIYTNCNSSYLNFIGKKKEEVIGKTAFDLFGKEDAKTVISNDNIILNSNQKHTFYEEINRYNKINYFETIKQPLFDEDTKTTSIYCVAKNITKEKEYKILNEDSNEILEYIVIHNNIDKILNKIVEIVEKRFQFSSCDIAEYLKKSVVTDKLARDIFGIYSDHIKKPSEFELKMIKNFAHLISIVFEKDEKNKQLLKKEEDGRNLEFRIEEKN